MKPVVLYTGIPRGQPSKALIQNAAHHFKNKKVGKRGRQPIERIENARQHCFYTELKIK